MSFWDNQLVLYDDNEDFTEIQNPVVLQDTPYILPKGYEWCIPSVIELYNFLNNHYNNDIPFSLYYSLEFLDWYKKDIIIGVKSNNEMVGCIVGTIENIIIYEQCKECVFINFLCTHKKLRKKRLSTMLIKEITRQISKLNIYIAMYCSENKLHNPFVKSNYYHYFVNIPNIIDTEFYMIPNKYKRFKQPIKQLIQYYDIPCIEHNMIPFTEEYIPNVFELFKTYFEKFTIKLDFEKYDITRLLYRENVMYSYISKDCKDFISFYLIPIQTKNKKLYNVFTLYLITDDYETLFKKIYTIVKELDFDLISIYNNMDNEFIIDKYNFEMGQIFYQYIYNFKYKQIPSNLNSILFF